MSTPTRRLAPRHDFGMADIAQRLNTIAPEIDAGYAALKDELRNAGWPTRTPDDDRTPSINPPESSSLTHSDQVANLATGNATALQGDRDAMQDHRHIIETSLAALVRLSAKHRAAGVPAAPCCTRPGCTDPVEAYRLSGGRLGYLGCEMVAGVWYAKDGVDPVCTKHRKEQARPAGRRVRRLAESSDSEAAGR